MKFAFPWVTKICVRRYVIGRGRGLRNNIKRKLIQHILILLEDKLKIHMIKLSIILDILEKGSIKQL